MAFEKLAQHVTALGGLRKTERKGLDDDELEEVAELLGAPVPAPWKWWLSTYGDATKFAEPVVYDDPETKAEVMIGYFMSIDEMREAIDDLEDSLAPQRVPFNDDASGNYLVIDSKGAVSWHIHDKPRDRNTKRVADSFDKFLLMLRRGE